MANRRFAREEEEEERSIEQRRRCFCGENVIQFTNALGNLERFRGSEAVFSSRERFGFRRFIEEEEEEEGEEKES